MKKFKLYHLIYLLPSLFLQPAFAQSPQGMNYQAIARDAGGTIIPNKAISIRITITNGSSGPVLYRELQSPTTNQFGLFTLNVGNGTADTTLSFDSIPWASASPWMTVEMDVNGGSNYVNMGNSQLLSVPYALFAASSNTGQSSNTVLGTGGVTVTSADSAYPFILLPGLTQTVNVPVNSNVLISSSGAIETNGSGATGYSAVDIGVFIDGAFSGLGLYKRVIAANTTGLGGYIANWSFTCSQALAPGLHVLDVRAIYAQGASAGVSGDGSSVLQGSLTATVIKN